MRTHGVSSVCSLPCKQGNVIGVRIQDRVVGDVISKLVERCICVRVDLVLPRYCYIRTFSEERVLRGLTTATTVMLYLFIGVYDLTQHSMVGWIIIKIRVNVWHLTSTVPKTCLFFTAVTVDRTEPKTEVLLKTEPNRHSTSVLSVWHAFRL